LLLNAVGRDRRYLRQHILPGRKDTKARADHGLALARDVPRDAYARLPHLLVTRDRSIGWEARIGQENAICRFRWIDGRFWHDLSFPAQAVVECEIRPDLEAVLNE